MQIISNERLAQLLSTDGFLVNVDYPTKDVKLHKIDCNYCDPASSVGVKPSSKRINKTGEFWFSDIRKEANLKAREIAELKGYTYRICQVCNP